MMKILWFEACLSFLEIESVQGSQKQTIAELTFNFNFNLVESFDGFILYSSTPPTQPPTQPPTPEKVVSLSHSLLFAKLTFNINLNFNSIHLSKFI